MLPQIVFLDRATLTVPLRALDVPHEWVEYPGTAPTETAERLRTATVAIVNKVRITAEVLQQAPRLKLVAVAATGYNNVDLAACQARGVTVCNVRNYAAAGVTEHALMLMLALKRQLLAYRADLQGGAWQCSESFCLLDHPLHDLQGSVLTIVGGGALGQAMARVAEALGMQVIFAEHKGVSTPRAGYVPFDEALARADVLSLHCPLSPATQGLIGKRELGLMKSDAVLINTGRGGLVDEAALVAALQAGRLGGAGVDVLSEEPPCNGNPLLAVDLPNLIITPHVAWASVETVQKLAEQLLGNVEAFLRGAPRNVVG